MSIPGGSISPELLKRLHEVVKPDPVTGEIDDSDLLTAFRELEREDDPHLKALHASVEAERIARESAIDFDSFDFSSLPRITSRWRVTLESVGLVDPSNGGIVEEHQISKYPEARPNFQLVGWVPCYEPHRIGQMDRRYMHDFIGIPKDQDILLFLKKLFATPFASFEAGIPTTMVISQKLHGSEAAISAFLDTLPQLSWHIESSEAHGFMQDLIYGRAKRDYEQHIAAANKAKERGNKLLQSGQPNQRQKAVEAYTESLRRLEDALSQKVMEDEKKAVMKLIAIVCANRSFAYCKEGIGAGRDVETAKIDAENAIFADKFYAKAYVRLARAHEASGDLLKAKESIARGLRLTQLQDESVLVETLIELQTRGKGIPQDDKEFLKWAQTVLNDSALQDVQGQWRKGIEERMKPLLA